MFFLITDFFIWNKANSQQHTSHLSNLPKFRENEPTYIIKVIKEKWGQYFSNDHFCTPLCSKRNGNLVIKNFLEQKFPESSIINIIPKIVYALMR